MSDATLTDATPPSDARPRDAAATTFDTLATAACLHLALIAAGFAAFRRLAALLPPGASHNVDRTLFTSVNAVTLTGFAQSFAEVPNYPLAGRAALALLAVGGAGVSAWAMTALVARLFDLALSRRETILAIAASIVLPILLALPAGGFDAIFTGTSLGLAARWNLTPASSALAVGASAIAGVGPLGILALWKRGDAWTPIRATLVASAVVWLAATVALASVSRSREPIARRVGEAGVLALDARGLGLNEAWPRDAGPAATWTLVPLMLVGPSAGGFTGGVGLLPVLLLAAWVARSLRGESSVGKPAAIAMIWLAGGVVLPTVGLIAIEWAGDSLPGDRMLFAAVSAFANVGLSHDPLGSTGGPLLLLAVLELVGRWWPMLMLAWLARLPEGTPG